MDKDLDTLFSESLTSVSEGVRFLIFSLPDTLEFHRAVFECLSESARSRLVTELTSAPELAENILREIYRTIDPDGYRECYGEAGLMMPSDPAKTAISLALSEEASALRKRYPLFFGAQRPVFSEEDSEFVPSVQTIVKAALSFMDAGTLLAISECSDGLLTRAYTLLARKKGFDDLADAERALDAAAYDAEFTDGLCSGEG